MSWTWIWGVQNEGWSLDWGLFCGFLIAHSLQSQPTRTLSPYRLLNDKNMWLTTKKSSVWIIAAISVCIYGGLEVIVWVLMEDNRATADNPWPVARYIFNSLWCEETFNNIDVYKSTFWNRLGGETKTRPRSRADTAAALLPLSDIQLPAIMRSRENPTSSWRSATLTTSTSISTSTRTISTSLKRTAFNFKKMRPGGHYHHPVLPQKCLQFRWFCDNKKSFSFPFINTGGRIIIRYSITENNWIWGDLLSYSLCDTESECRSML